MMTVFRPIFVIMRSFSSIFIVKLFLNCFSIPWLYHVSWGKILCTVEYLICWHEVFLTINKCVLVNCFQKNMRWDLVSSEATEQNQMARNFFFLRTYLVHCFHDKLKSLWIYLFSNYSFALGIISSRWSCLIQKKGYFFNSLFL